MHYPQWKRESNFFSQLSLLNCAILSWLYRCWVKGKKKETLTRQCYAMCCLAHIFQLHPKLRGKSCIFIVQHPEHRQGNNSGTSQGVLWSCTWDWERANLSCSFSEAPQFPSPPFTLMHISSNWEIAVLSSQDLSLHKKAEDYRKGVTVSLSSWWSSWERVERRKPLGVFVEPNRIMDTGVPKSGYFNSTESTIYIKDEGIIWGIQNWLFCSSSGCKNRLCSRSRRECKNCFWNTNFVVGIKQLIQRRERTEVTEQSCTRDGVFRALELAPGAGSCCRAGVVLCMGGSDRNQYFAEVKNGYSVYVKWKWAGYWSWSCREWACGIVWQCSQQWVREKGRANRKQKPHEKEGASSYRKPGLARLLGLPGCGKN